MRPPSFIRFGLISLLISSAASAAPQTQSIAQQPPGVSGVVPPNVLWALSVEFPTAGEAYTDRLINTLPEIQTKYIGYFDSDKCYDYSGAGTANGYFYPVATVNNATNRTCANSRWSGNLLNWATMTAVDIFRATLTGGNRALGNTGASAEYAAGDTATTTYLRRARVFTGQNANYGFSGTGTGAARRWVNTTSGSTTVNVSNLTPYTSGSLYFSSSNWGFTVYNNIGTSIGTFNAVVKVCDNSIGLESNCNAYNNNGTVNYKPEGLIQENAAQMRFGVFSYLNDSNYNRDGGVLRARMKSTGTTTTATANDPATNTSRTFTLGAEWSSSNGTFVTNPDTTDATDSGVSNSGNINMINKFGDTSGYKTYDPGGELFYAAQRYFRKLGNYSAYTDNLTAAMKDNFPVITNWDDPIANSCQKNFTIYIGDTNTHGDVDLPGSSWTGTTPRWPTDDTAFNVTTLLNTMGISANNTGSSNSPPYIAALAYWGNTTDIRSDLTGTQNVKAFMIDTVENGGTKTETSNAFYLAAKWGGFTDSNNNNIPDLLSEWVDSTRTIGAYPTGVPKNFAQANNPSAMVTALTNAINNVSQSARQTLVTPTVNGGSVRPDGTTKVFVPSFNANNWTGDLQAYSISASNTLTSSWSAQTQLESFLNTSGASARNVFTYNSSSRTGSLFNSSQAWLVTALNRTPSGTTDSYGTQRINYIRGDKTSETSSPFFRPRTTHFGDVVNSSPVYISAPSGQLADCNFTSNSTELTAIKNRTPMVAVGSNDGMLHVINANNGNEVFSYVPGSILGKLPNLMNSLFTHQYYVDGPILAANVCSGGVAKTILTGSTGAGGNGLFALDITRATASGYSFGNSNVLWEFTSADDNNLGITVAQPQLVKLRDGVDANNKPLYKYALITGNGLNKSNTSDTKSSLFIIYLDGPGSSGWIRNTHYRRLDAGAADTSSSSTDITPNGLMSPAAVDTNGDGVTDYIYAGDINGKLWKFDLTSSTPANWSVLMDTQPTPQPKAFFSAYSVAMVSGTLTNQIKQPIVAAPQVIRHPAGGLMILFGTGKLFDSSTLASTQYLYGIRDKMDGTTLSTTAGSSLQAQTLNNSTVNGSGSNSSTVYQGSSSSTTDYSTQNGWYLPLQSSERVLASAAIRQGRVQFTSIIPSSDPCLAGGDSWVTEIKPFSGGQLPVPIFDTNGDGKINGSDSLVARQKISGLSGGMLNLSAGQFSTLRLGGNMSPNLSEGRQPMRISWREIVNSGQ